MSGTSPAHLGGWLGRLLGLLALLALPATSVAQAPKSGNDYFEETVDVGFRVKFPKDWELVPPQPGEANLMATYVPDTGLGVVIDGLTMKLGYWIVKFDRRGQEDGKSPGAQSVEDWVDRIRYVNGTWSKIEEKKAKVGKLPATSYEFEATLSGTDQTAKAFALSIAVTPECDVAVVGIGPGDKRWRKYGKVYEKLGKTLKPMELEKVEVTAVKGDSAVRARRRAELQEELAGLPGWELYDSPNYFVVTNNEDKKFIKELIERLEAIREVYEETYPPDEARRLREEIALAKSKEKAQKERRTTVEADPFELSKASVVRVCKDKSQYIDYGGSSSSAGYWNSGAQELVIFDDKERGGRRNTWAVLNHEAFHQYIFYFYGNIAPHSWYNEGTGDFYSGYQLKGRRFKLSPFDWRVGTVKTMINEGRTVPIETFTRFTQREYYTDSQWGHPGEHYAQGWAFIWFLRTGKKNAKGWNDDWDKILPTYLETLLWTEDLDEAVEKAFQGVDYEEIEAAWKAYI